MSGSDIVARMASASDPRRITTGWADRRSTATVRNGVGRSSKSSMSKYGAAMRPRSSSTSWPLLRAVGGTTPPLRPNSRRDGYARASVLRRMFLYANVDAPNS